MVDEYDLEAADERVEGARKALEDLEFRALQIDAEITGTQQSMRTCADCGDEPERTRYQNRVLHLMVKRDRLPLEIAHAKVALHRARQNCIKLHAAYREVHG